jgi:hypothetical protein
MTTANRDAPPATREARLVDKLFGAIERWLRPTVEGLEARLDALERRADALEQPLQNLGKFTFGCRYKAGSVVTHKSGVWIADAHTGEAPGESPHWRALLSGDDD